MRPLLRENGPIQTALETKAKSASSAGCRFNSFEEGERALHEALDGIKPAVLSGSDEELRKVHGRIEEVMLALARQFLLSSDVLAEVRKVVETVKGSLSTGSERDDQSEKPEVLELSSWVDVTELARQKRLQERYERCEAILSEVIGTPVKKDGSSASEAASSQQKLTLRQKYRNVRARIWDAKKKEDIGHENSDDDAGLEDSILTLQREESEILRQCDALARELRQLAIRDVRSQHQSPTPYKSTGAESAALGTSGGSKRKQEEEEEEVPKPGGLSGSSNEEENDEEVTYDFPEMFDHVMIYWNLKPRCSTAGQKKPVGL